MKLQNAQVPNLVAHESKSQAGSLRHLKTSLSCTSTLKALRLALDRVGCLDAF